MPQSCWPLGNWSECGATECLDGTQYNTRFPVFKRCALILDWLLCIELGDKGRDEWLGSRGVIRNQISHGDTCLIMAAAQP